MNLSSQILIYGLLFKILARKLDIMPYFLKTKIRFKIRQKRNFVSKIHEEYIFGFQNLKKKEDIFLSSLFPFFTSLPILPFWHCARRHSDLHRPATDAGHPSPPSPTVGNPKSGRNLVRSRGEVANLSREARDLQRATASPSSPANLVSPAPATHQSTSSRQPARTRCTPWRARGRPAHTQVREAAQASRSGRLVQQPVAPTQASLGSAQIGSDQPGSCHSLCWSFGLQEPTSPPAIFVAIQEYHRQALNTSNAWELTKLNSEARSFRYELSKLLGLIVKHLF